MCNNSVPEVIEEFGITIINASTILTTWRPPAITNGVILFYEVNISTPNNFIISNTYNNTNYDQETLYSYTATRLGIMTCSSVVLYYVSY